MYALISVSDEKVEISVFQVLVSQVVSYLIWAFKFLF